MKHAPTALALTSALSATLCAAPPPPAASTDLPVREIALFSSGVGYFQHEGPVRDNARAELQFKTAQINDLLKSLVLQDLGGGTIGAVTYPSQDPVEKTLRSFQVDITGNPPLADLLNQLRGAKVTLSAGAEKLQGTILGVEVRDVPGGEKSGPLKAAFLNVIATGLGIRSVAISDVRSLQFDDAALQAELEKALAALSAARDKDKKTVGLAFNGKGERSVRLGYVVETPVWKTSYRLIFGGTEAKPRLQGWALIENQTENDWNDVKLSLVSGRPISFIQDLYQPLYVQRQVVQNETYASVKPQVYAAGRPQTPPQPESFAEEKQRGGIAGGMLRRKAGPANTPAEGLRQLPSYIGATTTENDSNGESSLGATAATKEVGELFQYSVGGVTLPRQRSAMIPIVNDLIEAEKVSIYNAGVEARFPLNGARLKNSVNLHLLGGPITIFDEGRYAGDARIGDVPPGQTRLLSYGLDIQLPVMIEDIKSKQIVTSGKIVGGVLEISRKSIDSRTYVAENKSTRAKKLVIEHPRSATDSKLSDTPPPAETTPELFRFDVSLAPGKTEKLAVREERILSESVELVDESRDQLLVLIKEGEFTDAVRAALTKAANLQQASEGTEKDIETRNEQIQKITEEQNRIRENLKTAGERSEYGVRLLKKLNEQETQIEKLQAQVASLQTKLENQQKELGDYLKGLNIK